MLISSGILLTIAVLAFWLWTPDKDRKSLEAIYLRSPADLIDVSGLLLHVRDDGPRNAPAVFFLHGFGASLHTWEPWANSLKSEFRVIRIDLPGSGLSAPDPQGDYSDARSMQILLALMDKLGLQRASVVGNSIGGRIAWTFAAQHPARVNKLVLVSPDGFASPGFEYGMAPEVPSTLSLMRFILPKPLLRMSLKPAYADPKVLTDALATRYHDLMLAPGSRDALLARMTQTVLIDPVPWLQRIQAPTLLLWGKQDGMIPFANSAEYVRSLPNSKLVPLPGVGHLAHEESPEMSIKSLREFLHAG